ncbi:hypothetical protein AZSI13_32520 [Azospira sp. I13]|uniref:ArsR family transcriptional regulator n=1 Tax=Azospira sp. I13 TaxID=1765050 RepID=UPI000D40A206|nr:ArsR family transcriptional regulator [Azospira sp. I13]GBG03925.1 hypothetical protein AZSI13_32520 [Azospira sp. I13]
MNERYRNEAQQRLCKVICLLAGNEFNGLAPSEIAKAVNVSPPNITRDLANLKEAGLAEQLPDTGRWRLGPKLVQIGLAFTAHLDKSRSRLDEMTNRYTRQP